MGLSSPFSSHPYEQGPHTQKKWPMTAMRTLYTQPLEPCLFPRLRHYFADFPYLRYTISPEAINLEDLMRLSVRDGLKMKKQSRSTALLQFHDSALFSSTTHYFSGNSSDTQLSEVIIMQRLPTTLWLPLKEIEKKPISYWSKERQVFASLIKSNSAVSVLTRRSFDTTAHQCCFYTEKKTLHWIATAFIMFIWVASTYPDRTHWCYHQCTPHHAQGF